MFYLFAFIFMVPLIACNTTQCRRRRREGGDRLRGRARAEDGARAGPCHRGLRARARDAVPRRGAARARARRAARAGIRARVVIGAGAADAGFSPS